MNNFVYDNNRFIYVEGESEKVLLDCNDFLKNKSRIPFHALTEEEEVRTIPRIILDLLDETDRILEGTEWISYDVYYTLIDVLVTAYHVNTAAPKNVLELGCQNGMLSYHLATLLGKLHPQSLLYSVSNTLGNGSDLLWMDFISRVEELPQIAFAAADYEQTHLKDEHFDIVIINGNMPMDHPDLIMKEAMRLTKQNGMILCFAAEQPLLESCFQLFFMDREEYFLHYKGKILVAQKK